MLGLPEILALALGLALDAFAVCLVAGATGAATDPRAVFRLSFHFGLFQFLMPVLGWLLGSTVVELIAPVDHWIAFGLLALVGGKMIREGLGNEETSLGTNPTRGWTLVSLSVATSLDALAVGLSLALVGTSIWLPAAIIGVLTALLCLLGIVLGRTVAAHLGGKVEVLGGLVLLGIGLRILWVHLGL
ncbi:MAG: hypothetical protein A2284_07240 [Deltaproteobacteria bacterium RIFOXYA12_FULL_61_11]|nr:MAG: hypothetical protein A2284_07240 [Deltaproteobacteria bacterium RIFOXYA12_FULL_61_11]